MQSRGASSVMVLEIIENSYLTVQAGVDHLPALRVHIIAVQLVGQSVISSAAKHVQVAIEGNHCVAITALWRWRRAS